MDRSNATEAVSAAIQAGYRHIDCAAAYKNQDLVGKGIADGLAKTGLKREDLWITSKLWNDHHGPKNVEPAIDIALADLNLTHLDLYHMHWPVATSSFTGANKIEYLATWAAMSELVHKGKTRHIGVSNFSPHQLQTLLNATTHPPAVHQMELHPYLPQRDWLAWHAEHGIHVTAYSPFAGTNPTYAPGEPPQLLHNKVLESIGARRDCTPAQVALAWGLRRGTSVLPKSSHAARIAENFGAVRCELTDEDVGRVDDLAEYHHRFNNPGKAWGVELYEGLEDSRGKHRDHE